MARPIQYYFNLIPSDELDQQIDEKHRNERGHIVDRDLGKIADAMPDWEGDIATALELSESDIVGIRKGQHQGDVGLQKRAALLKWKSKFGSSATPRALIKTFFDAGLISCVEAVRSVLGKKSHHDHKPGTQVVTNRANAGTTVDDETATPAVKKVKTDTGSSAKSHSNNVEPDSGDIDGLGLAAAQDKPKATSMENVEFNWCSFTGQQLPSTTLTIIEGAYSAALPRGVVLWDKKEVTVTITDMSLLTKWKIDPKHFMSLVNKWHQLQSDSKPGETNYIPKFVGARMGDDADIIVELNEKGANRTLPGKAGKVGSNDPTMWLDLSNKDGKYNDHLVVHEFGHALGLGHEHQRSDFRECVIPFLDEEKMKQRVTKATYKDWEVDVNLELGEGKATEYDPESVMHYWFDKSWLKFGYDKIDKIERNATAGILSEKMKNALLGIHHRSSGIWLVEPSAKDLEFINGVYKNVFVKPAAEPEP